MAADVLHVLDTAALVGTSFVRTLGGLARHLDREKYRIHACFLSEEGPLIGDLRQLGIDSWFADWSGTKSDPVGAWRFWGALRRGKYAIVHHHSGARLLRMLARSSGAKIVTQVTAVGLESDDSAPAHPVSFAGADAVIANSQAAARHVIGASPRVIYVGVATDRIRERTTRDPRGRFTVGTACRLAPAKGIVYLLRAVADISEDLPQVRLQIAGDGPERSQLEAETRALNLTERVSFLGWRKDLDSLLADWDAFVVPSLRESLPTALLEAMAAGLPVVASNVGGIPEAVDDGGTGWLAPPGDVEALTQRLRQIAENPEQAHAVGMAARKEVEERFGDARMAAEISAVYDEVLHPGV